MTSITRLDRTVALLLPAAAASASAAAGPEAMSPVAALLAAASVLLLQLSFLSAELRSSAWSPPGGAADRWPAARVAALPRLEGFASSAARHRPRPMGSGLPEPQRRHSSPDRWRGWHRKARWPGQRMRQPHGRWSCPGGLQNGSAIA